LTGGYTTGPRQLVELLRNRSRPYLFSNTLPPPVVGATLKVCLSVSLTALIPALCTVDHFVIVSRAANFTDDRQSFCTF